MFGLVDTGQGRATLTKLGRESLDGAGDERTARVMAFLNVELFRVMYEQFRGNALPPPAALERQMEQLGVSPKQKERARQTFIKSANFAHFIDAATGRFVKPGIAPGAEAGDKKKLEEPKGGGGDGGSGAGGLNLDPLLVALLKKVPVVGDGWPAPQRIRWFRTFAMNVSQIYDQDDSPVEMEIKAIKAEDV